MLGLANSQPAKASQSVALAWNPSTAGGVAGYKIHYGNDGVTFDNVVDTGTNASWTVTGLQEGQTNYFIVTAYDVNGVESSPSNQTVYYVPGVVKMALGAGAVPGKPVPLSFPVAPGHTYQVQASTDLKNWVTIWSTTAATNGWIQYQDPQGTKLQQRFYRTVSN